MTETYDIAISGGGMVGMSMAIALARAGMRVALLEKTSLDAQLEQTFDGRVSAIAMGSMRILDGIGAWEFIAAHAEPIRDIRITDGHAPVFLHFDPKEVGSDTFGFIVENRHTRMGLQQAAAALPNLVIYDRVSIQAYRIEGEQVWIALATAGGEKQLTSRLLVGAEGRKSAVRSLAGIETTGWSYAQTAIVCSIAHEKPHFGLAQERFLPAGPFAVLPMQGNRSSLVWVEPQERAPLYMELPDAEFVQEIRERAGDYLGEIRLVGERFTYPLSLLHAKRYCAPRVALIGDAAHGMHPLAGQGVNVGFRDVAALSALISQRFALGLDIGDEGTLSQYERLRRFDNVTMLAAMDGLNRLFSNNIPPIRAARDAGLWVVSKLPFMKRFFMTHAMGLSAISGGNSGDSRDKITIN